MLIDRDNQDAVRFQQCFREPQALLHERKPLGVSVGVVFVDETVVVLPVARSRVVGRVDVDAVHLPTVRVGQHLVGMEVLAVDDDMSGLVIRPTAYQQPPVSLVSCPSCGAAQHSSNRHCEQCGARLGQGTVPVAPRPLASISPGTRALTVILAVLAGVVLLALIYQSTIGSNDEPAPEEEVATETETPVPAQVGPLDQITPIDIQCSTELSTTLSCANLIDDTTNYWNDNSLRGEGAEIIVTFGEPVRLEQVLFVNAQTLRRLDLRVDSDHRDYGSNPSTT